MVFRCNMHRLNLNPPPPVAKLVSDINRKAGMCWRLQPDCLQVSSDGAEYEQVDEAWSSRGLVDTICNNHWISGECFPEGIRPLVCQGCAGCSG